MRRSLCNRTIFSVAALGYAASVFAADVPRDPEAFTGYAEARLQPEISTVPVHATGVLAVTIGPINDNLTALYDSCQANPDGCEAAIRVHAQGIKDTLGIKR